MSSQKTNSKKPRKHKVSGGENAGARKMHPKLTDVQKVLMGKGMMHRSSDSRGAKRDAAASRARTHSRYKTAMGAELSENYKGKRSGKAKVGRFPKNG